MDSFFGIGLFELVMIAVIALLVMGPERLPGAMREVAKYMRQLRSISNEFQSQFSDELKMLDEMNPRRIINDVMDPNASPTATSTTAKTTAAKTPAAAKTSTTTPAKPLAANSPAKSPATAPPNASAATIGTAAAGAATGAASGSAAIVNGESPNTILPPAKGEAAPNASEPLAVSDLPAPGAPQPAEVDLAGDRFVDAPSDLSAQNGANGVHPQDKGVEAAQ
jgi:sec-independent protein translocase protein TatB